jgi:dTDP-4-amino-4,6-dideoxygalactose transaminase
MAIHREPPYSHEKWNNRLPQTNVVADTTIILPLFHTMTEEEVDYVIDCLEQIKCSSHELEEFKI